jgi:xylan 1,4-beta-xylosidase
VRKPSWFAYKYLNALRGNEVPSADKQVLAAVDGGKTAVVVWDWQHPEQKTTSNGVFFAKPVPNGPAAGITLNLKNVAAGSYRVQVRRTGHKTNDAYTAYLEMGAPKDLRAEQLATLHALTQDKPEVNRVVKIGKDGKLQWKLAMRSNDIALVTLEPVAP